MARRTDSRKAGRKRRRSVPIILFLLLGVSAGGLWLYFNPGGLDKVKGLFGREETAKSEEQPVRGSIFDRNYKGLAVSLERVGVYVRTRELGSFEFVAEKLAPVLEMDEGHQAWREAATIEAMSMPIGQTWLQRPHMVQLSNSSSSHSFRSASVTFGPPNHFQGHSVLRCARAIGNSL